jgi:hypothetical protein
MDIQPPDGTRMHGNFELCLSAKVTIKLLTTYRRFDLVQDQS